MALSNAEKAGVRAALRGEFTLTEIKRRVQLFDTAGFHLRVAREALVGARLDVDLDDLDSLIEDVREADENYRLAL